MKFLFTLSTVLFVGQAFLTSRALAENVVKGIVKKAVSQSVASASADHCPELLQNLKNTETEEGFDLGFAFANCVLTAAYYSQDLEQCEGVENAAMSERLKIITHGMCASVVAHKKKNRDECNVESESVKKICLIFYDKKDESYAEFWKGYQENPPDCWVQNRNIAKSR